MVAPAGSWPAPSVGALAVLVRRPARGAVRAQARDCQMTRIDLKAQRPLRRPGQAEKELVGCMDPHATLRANQVRVGAGSKLIRDGTMPEVRVGDHTHTLELLEVPVHRGDMDLGCTRPNLGPEVLGVPVALILEQYLEQDPSGRRGPSARSTDHLEDSVYRRRFTVGRTEPLNGSHARQPRSRLGWLVQ